MKLSMKWLGDYVKLNLSLKEFADGMTMSGSKVEGYEIEGNEISGVVVGNILSIAKHPNADKLVVCQVDVGQSAPVQIVTAATNVFKGAIVPVCLDGAVLPGGKEIRAGELRGEMSLGMLCGLNELGLTVHDFPYAVDDGIFIIKEDCEIGQEIQSAIGLDDAVVSFEITSNRPDCLSVIGLAREAAAWFDRPIAVKTPVVKNEQGTISDYLQAKVEDVALCNRYMAKVVKNVKIGPSPRWMRERLRASGVRPINNLVDITNYVMLSYGQPMHAFDLKHVAGNQIVVRRAQKGEKLVTLDGMKHQLQPNMLVIADAEKPMGVAGVMGGEQSGIFEDTSTVVFEAACFDGAAVRIASKQLGLRTESSSRFEKGLPAQPCEEALLYACQLVEMLGAGDVVGGTIDEKVKLPEPMEIPFSADWINQLLGTQIPRKIMEASLEKLGFGLQGETVIAPPYRIDVTHQSDVAEEVARMFGYEQIPMTVIRGEAHAEILPTQRMQQQCKELLRAVGLSEIYAYSFLGAKAYDKLGIANEDPLRKAVLIQNPLGEDSSVMRTTTLATMLGVLSRNYNNRNPKAWLYELGRVYRPRPGQGLPEEREMVTIGLYGDADFFALKGVAQSLLDVLRVQDYQVEPYTEMPFHCGRAAKLVKNGVTLGLIGEVHPQVQENFEIGTRCYLGCFDLALLQQLREEATQYRPLPKYPASSRDLSLVCEQLLPAAVLEEAIRAGVGTILEDVSLFDLYQGEQVAGGQKSVSYSIRMRAQDHTLTDAEADVAIARALEKLQAVGATLRQ